MRTPEDRVVLTTGEVAFSAEADFKARNAFLGALDRVAQWVLEDLKSKVLQRSRGMTRMCLGGVAPSLGQAAMWATMLHGEEAAVQDLSAVVSA